MNSQHGFLKQLSSYIFSCYIYLLCFPVLPDEVLQGKSGDSHMTSHWITWYCALLISEAMPGNIRKAEHFMGFLRRFNEYLKVRCWERKEEGFVVVSHNCHMTRPGCVHSGWCPRLQRTSFNTSTRQSVSTRSL